jgi:hypothetical protein
MHNRNTKLKTPARAKAKADQTSVTAVAQSDCSPPDAFLAEAMKEPKRILLMDFIGTIRTLRFEKKFTFRAIAEWFAKRGVETDHSAVYRAYLASIPERQRNPEEDWSDVEEPDYGDENVQIKKS